MQQHFDKPPDLTGLIHPVEDPKDYLSYCQSDYPKMIYLHKDSPEGDTQAGGISRQRNTQRRRRIPWRRRSSWSGTSRGRLGTPTGSNTTTTTRKIGRRNTFHL